MFVCLSPPPRPRNMTRGEPTALLAVSRSPARLVDTLSSAHPGASLTIPAASVHDLVLLPGGWLRIPGSSMPGQRSRCVFPASRHTLRNLPALGPPRRVQPFPSIRGGGRAAPALPGTRLLPHRRVSHAQVEGGRVSLLGSNGALTPRGWRGGALSNVTP